MHTTAQRKCRKISKLNSTSITKVTSKMTTWFFILFTMVCVSSISHAQSVFSATPDSIFSDSPSFLKVDEAFGFDFEQRGSQLVVKWTIADGYYLYKKQFKTASKNVVLGEALYPASQQIEDEFFGLSEVFFDDMEMVFPIVKAEQDGSVKLRFQGCAKAGLCYPPTTKVIFLEAFNSGLLSPEQAFIPSLVSSSASELVFDINIADTYFLQKDTIRLDAIRY